METTKTHSNDGYTDFDITEMREWLRDNGLEAEGSREEITARIAANYPGAWMIDHLLCSELGKVGPAHNG